MKRKMIGFCSRGKQTNQQSDSMKVKCDECGKITHKKPRQIQKYKHHFCNKNCYLNYMRKHSRVVICNGVNMKPFRKLKKFAQLRKQIMEGKQIHENINYSYNR